MRKEVIEMEKVITRRRNEEKDMTRSTGRSKKG